MLRHENTFVIKTLIDVHSCYRLQHNRQVTVEFIANEFIEKFKKNPSWLVKEIEAKMMDKYGVKVNSW